MRIWQKFIKKISQEYLLLLLGIATIFLLLLSPISLSLLPNLVHWPTIFTLATLLILTTGIKQSGLLKRWASQLLQLVETERGLWLILVVFAALSSMILTNDIALFLIIPFTLQLNDQLTLNIKPLLVLETIAVNAGSTLTPIGNPQNIYLWQLSGVSFGRFILAMLPAFALQAALLLGLTCLVSTTTPLPQRPSQNTTTVDYKLAGISALLLAGFLLSAHLGVGVFFLIITIILFLLTYRNILLATDWTLVILFLFLFVDMGIIAQLPFLQTFNDSINLARPSSLFLLGAGYSQIISNVPATLLLSHYTEHWKYLAWGVNIGGNGLMIASFANFISLRLSRPKKLGWRYHLYAIPFLLISGGLVYLWFILG